MRLFKGIGFKVYLFCLFYVNCCSNTFVMHFSQQEKCLFIIFLTLFLNYFHIFLQNLSEERRRASPKNNILENIVNLCHHICLINYVCIMITFFDLFRFLLKKTKILAYFLDINPFLRVSNQHQRDKFPIFFIFNP